MSIERALRGIAGSFVLLSLVLAYVHSPWWLIFTAFVGANLLQSAFSNYCPMMSLLSRAGVGGTASACAHPARPERG